MAQTDSDVFQRRMFTDQEVQRIEAAYETLERISHDSRWDRTHGYVFVAGNAIIAQKVLFAFLNHAAHYLRPSEGADSAKRALDRILSAPTMSVPEDEQS